jgi:hypothetical protein
MTKISRSTVIGKNNDCQATISIGSVLQIANGAHLASVLLILLQDITRLKHSVS